MKFTYPATTPHGIISPALPLTVSLPQCSTLAFFLPTNCTLEIFKSLSLS